MALVTEVVIYATGSIVILVLFLTNLAVLRVMYLYYCKLKMKPSAFVLLFWVSAILMNMGRIGALTIMVFFPKCENFGQYRENVELA